MPAEGALGGRLSLLRTAMAAAVAEAIDRPLIAGPGASGKEYLAVAGGLGGLGRALGEEMLPLEKRFEAAQGNPSGGAGAVVTDVDRLLESFEARLNDSTLNPALPFQLEPPTALDLKPLNEVYGDLLDRAEVAGSVSLGDEAADADALLFDDGAPTPALQKYQEYEAKAAELAERLAALPADGDPAEADRLKSTLARVEAEWVGIGHKTEIERAFRIVSESQDDATFEDERAAVRSRFESGERVRRDGLSYYESHLVPLAPLFNPDADEWIHVTLDAARLGSLVGPELAEAFGIDPEVLERELVDTHALEFDYLRCQVQRDWLDWGFLAARYWRLDGDEVVSDGLGAGTIPAVPTALVTVRNLELSVNALTLTYEGKPEESGAKVSTVPMPPRVLLPVDPKVRDHREDLSQIASKAGLAKSAHMFTAMQITTIPTLMIATGAGNSSAKRPPSAPSAGNATTPASRPSPQVKVRDHRAGATKPDPRKIRGLKGLRGRAASLERLRGGTSTRKRPSETVSATATGPVVVRATVNAPGDLGARTAGLRIGYRAVEPDVGEETIEAMQESSGGVQHKITLPRTIEDGGQSVDVAAYALVVYDGDDTVLAEQVVQIAGATGGVALTWKASWEPRTYALAEEQLMLHSYVLRVTPKCPDPDPDLQWGDDPEGGQ